MGVLNVAAMPPAGARGEQRGPLLLRHGKELPDHGAEGGADLHDGPFPAHGAAAADAQGGGECLHDGHRRADDSLPIMDGVHHFGDAVTLRLRGEARDEERDAYGAKGRHQDDDGPHGPSGGVRVGVVRAGKPPEKEHIVDETYQTAEEHGAQPSDDASQDRKADHCRPTKRSGAVCDGRQPASVTATFMPPSRFPRPPRQRTQRPGFPCSRSTVFRHGPASQGPGAKADFLYHGRVPCSCVRHRSPASLEVDISTYPWRWPPGYQRKMIFESNSRPADVEGIRHPVPGRPRRRQAALTDRLAVEAYFVDKLRGCPDNLMVSDDW